MKMAAAEKICEYSGEYPSWNMYGYKRNLIQIMPEYRKLFRGQHHELIIFKPKLYWEKRGSFYSLYDSSEMNWYEPGFKDEQEFIQWYKWRYHARLVKHYDYCLIVPGLPGIVYGKYWNYTYHLPTALRKLKRLLRCKELNVKYIDSFFGMMDDAGIKDGIIVSPFGFSKTAI